VFHVKHFVTLWARLAKLSSVMVGEQDRLNVEVVGIRRRVALGAPGEFMRGGFRAAPGCGPSVGGLLSDLFGGLQGSVGMKTYAFELFRLDSVTEPGCEASGLAGRRFMGPIVATERSCWSRERRRAADRTANARRMGTSMSHWRTWS